MFQLQSKGGNKTEPSVSDALIHAKIPGWCCHALTCRFYFPPCLPAMLIRPENGHSYCCMHENDTRVTSAAISPAIDELAQAEGMCGFYLLTVFAAFKYRLINYLIPGWRVVFRQALLPAPDDGNGPCSQESVRQKDESTEACCQAQSIAAPIH